MYPKSTADTSAGLIEAEADPQDLEDEIEADLGQSERYEDSGLRIRSKGRGKFAYFVGREQAKELGYIDITDFSDEERLNYEQRSKQHQHYTDAAARARARADRGGVGTRA